MESNRDESHFITEILPSKESKIFWEDLKKPLSSPGKKYLAVVATVSLGKLILADHAEYVTEEEDENSMKIIISLLEPFPN